MHKLRKIEKDISLLDMQQDKTIPISPWKISHISFSFICITSENKSKSPQSQDSTELGSYTEESKNCRLVRSDA
jgi:GH18 family chitinase